jgi:hypothetical protein
MREGGCWTVHFLWKNFLFFSYPAHGSRSEFFSLRFVLRSLFLGLVWIGVVRFDLSSVKAVSLLPAVRCQSVPGARARSRFLLLVSKLCCWSVVHDLCAGAKLTARFRPFTYWIFHQLCFPLESCLSKEFLSRCPLLFSVWRLAVQSPVLVRCAELFAIVTLSMLGFSEIGSQTLNFSEISL